MAETDSQVAPDVPVTPAADTAPPPDPTAGQEVESEDKPEAKPERTFTQKEVDEIAAKRAAQAERRALKIARAEAEAAYWKEQAQQRQPQAVQRDGEPKPEDFQGRPWSDYLDARAKWQTEQIVEERLAKTREEMEQRDRAHQVQAADRDLARKLQDGASKYPDFREVVGAEDLPITRAMKATIGKVTNPADVAYYLGSNPHEAERIASLDEIEQVMEINGLAAKLGSGSPTRTPPPIRANAGTGKPASGYRPDMTDKEFAEWRRRSSARRR